MIYFCKTLWKACFCTMADSIKQQDLIPDGYPTLYFVDGFHGGIKGHMAPGSVLDVLHGLEANPDWRVELEIEPISFEYLRRHEPDVFYKLKEFAEAPYDEVRVEFPSAGFAQPFCWAISGESVIRQLVYGKRLINKAFPKAVVDTYAVQEPCFSSALPQLLNQLGFKRASLKNSTCWGGYTAGKDLEVCFWVGPDGSRIATVPRYECEDLIYCWAIQGSGYDKAAMDCFPEKCNQKGIEHPVGMTFQDLGWKGEPWVNEKYQHFVTWREYFDKIADKPTEDWHFSEEDILVTIPWGHKVLQKMTRQVRRAENDLIKAEKLSSIAGLLSGFELPSYKLCEAWENLMLSQHHDAWICAAAGSWASKAEYQTTNASTLSSEICEDAVASVNENLLSPCGEKYIRVFNTLGNEATSVVNAVVSLDCKAKNVAIYDLSGNLIPSQIRPFRKYNDNGSINACIISFNATVPPMGYSTYKVVPCDEASYDGIKISQNENEIKITTKFYTAVLDLNHGGTFSSLIENESGKDFVDKSSPYRFNEYRGFFIEDNEFFSTADVSVGAKITEQGPVRATVELSGLLNNQFFKIFLTFSDEEKAIKVKTFFHFKGVHIGHPWEPLPERNNLEPKKSNHDDTYKLRAVFPAFFGNGKLYKNSAFNVTESKLDNTTFMGWDKIKHNIIVNWVDAYDEKEDAGLTLFSLNTTSYQHGNTPDMPLGLTLAWGFTGGFWWGKSKLEGPHECEYAIMPHFGKWDKADVSFVNSLLNEPFTSSVICTEEEPKEKESLFSLSKGFEISAFYRENGKYYLRIFNATGENNTCSVKTALKLKGLRGVTVEGKEYDFTVNLFDNGFEIHDIPPFGIRTVEFDI